MTSVVKIFSRAFFNSCKKRKKINITHIHAVVSTRYKQENPADTKINYQV